MMKIVNAPVGARIVDSLPFSIGGTPLSAREMVAAGVQGIALYLGAATPAQVSAALGAGLGIIGVTFGGHYSGSSAVSQAKALGFPSGWPIFLDIEAEVVGPVTSPGQMVVRSAHRSLITRAVHVNASIGDLTKKVVDWAGAVHGAAFMPCGYFGAPQPFTSEEAWRLPIVRYWKGQGLARDRFGKAFEPDHSGWAMTQMWPSVTCGGVLVDHNMHGHDYANGGRPLPWAVAD